MFQSSQNLPFANQFFLFGVNFYRQRISHLKGYNCAASALGCRTCSTMAKRLLKRYPLSRAVFLQIEQFKKCHKTAKMIAIFRNTNPAIAQERVIAELGLTSYQAMLALQAIAAVMKGGMGGAEKDCPCLKFLPCVRSCFKNEFMPGFDEKFYDCFMKYVSPCSTRF